MTYLQHVDPADENDTERDDLCPSCGEYLPRYTRTLRYACGDCHGGTERDPWAGAPDAWAVPIAANH